MGGHLFEYEKARDLTCKFGEPVAPFVFENETQVRCSYPICPLIAMDFSHPFGHKLAYHHARHNTTHDDAVVILHAPAVAAILPTYGNMGNTRERARGLRFIGYVVPRLLEIGAKIDRAAYIIF